MCNCDIKRGAWRLASSFLCDNCSSSTSKKGSFERYKDSLILLWFCRLYHHVALDHHRWFCCFISEPHRWFCRCEKKQLMFAYSLGFLTHDAGAHTCHLPTYPCICWNACLTKKRMAWYYYPVLQIRILRVSKIICIPLVLKDSQSNSSLGDFKFWTIHTAHFQAQNSESLSTSQAITHRLMTTTWRHLKLFLITTQHIIYGGGGERINSNLDSCQWLHFVSENNFILKLIFFRITII